MLASLAQLPLYRDKGESLGLRESIQKQKVYMNSIVYIIGAVVLVVVVLKVLGIF